MRIDSSLPSQTIDTSYANKPQGEPAETVKAATVKTATDKEAKKTSPAVKDFERALGKEDFERIIEKIKDIPTNLTFTRLEFRIHDDTKRVMVKIYDKNNDELISEIPPEKFLDLLAGLWKQAGLIVDEKV